MDNVRLGVIGLGNMGSEHIRYLSGKAINGATLGAICDTDPAKLKKYSAMYKDVPAFATHGELMDSGTCDAVIIAVPHYEHVPMSLEAFKKGLHVLCEKPLAVSVTEARAVGEAYKNYPHLKFGVMFNQRTNPLFQKMRELVSSGEIGTISRITWICTAWFRSAAYYASSDWRATWKGEGGGVMINQCPHSLDLMQWITGMMPNRITSATFLGKTHPIEVEDEVSAILEYPSGAIGHFIASTGEAPGTNRLEICGTKGKLVVEEGKLKFYRNREDSQEYSRTTTRAFGTPEVWVIEIPVRALGGSEHQAMTQNYVNGVLANTPNDKLLGPGPEGVHGLELGNAMVMSGVTRKPVTLPLDGAAYDAFLEDMARKSSGKKAVGAKVAEVNLAASF